ncbi:ribonuclease H-like domain-containing protein [Tanacetum coccineum]
MILIAESGTHRRPPSPQVKAWRLCFNFAKGSCRFGHDCKFFHDHNAKNIDTSGSKPSGNNTDDLIVELLSKIGLDTTSSGSTGTTGQETTLRHAFTAGTLHDPTSGAWNMDTVSFSSAPSQTDTPETDKN